MLALAGQPVPSVSAHGGLLAAALRARGSAEAVTLAPRNVRDDPQRLCQNRRAGRTTEALDQARVPVPSAARRCPRAHHAPPHRPRPVTDAARAARARSRPPSTRTKASPPTSAVNPDDDARP